MQGIFAGSVCYVDTPSPCPPLPPSRTFHVPLRILELRGHACGARDSAFTHARTCACVRPLTAWLLSTYHAPGTVRGLVRRRPERGRAGRRPQTAAGWGAGSARATRAPHARRPREGGRSHLSLSISPPSVAEQSTAVCPVNTLKIQSRSPGVQQPGTEQSEGGGALGEGRRLAESRWSERPSHWERREPGVPPLSPSQPGRLDPAGYQAEEDGQKLYLSARAAGQSTTERGT